MKEKPICHVTADTEKSTVMQKIKYVTNASGKQVIISCPDGTEATLIYAGTTFHRTLNRKRKNST